MDLERNRVVREISDGEGFWPLTGSDRPTMACSRRGNTLSLHHPGGAPVDDGKIEFPAKVQRALVHPAQGRWLVFVTAHVDDEQRLGFVEVDAAGRTSAPRWFDGIPLKHGYGINFTHGWSFATSLTQRMSFVITHGDDTHDSLSAFYAERPSLPIEQVYRAPIPNDVCLARDSASQRVIALVADHERVHVAPLGPEPPVFPTCAREQAKLDLWDIPSFRIGCTFARTIDEDEQAAAREVRSYSERAATAWMQRRLEAADTDVAEVLYIYHVLRDASRSTPIENFLQWMQENLPSDPHTAMLHAVEHARAERWAEVRRWLEPVDAADTARAHPTAATRLDP